MKGNSKLYRTVGLILLVLFLCRGESWADADIYLNGNGAVNVDGTGVEFGPTDRVDLAPGTYHIHGKGIPANKCFYIKGNVTLHLHDVILSGADIYDTSPISFDTKSYTLNLYIYGTNELVGGDGRAGISVHENFETYVQTLIIQEGSSGALLTCRGGQDAAGIGGNRGTNAGWDAGNISIFSGKVYAFGGNLAAGIGGGTSFYVGDRGGHGGNITVSGGHVEATGGLWAAGIGGAYGSVNTRSGGGEGGLYTQTGGSVYANGGQAAPGIGGGAGVQYGAGAGSTVHISRGYLEATGGADAPAIGGAYSSGSPNTGAGGDVTITGGTVIAAGVGTGIGTANGSTASTGKLIITGGSVCFLRNTPTHIMGGDAGANPLRCVKTEALTASRLEEAVCSYTGSNDFYAKQYAGSYFFWMPENASTSLVSIHDLKNLTVPPIRADQNNFAPLIFSTTSKSYYTLNGPFDAGETGELKLESELPMYTNLTSKANMTINMNGKSIAGYGSNQLIVSNGNTLTLKNSTQTKVNLAAPVKMTGTGLLKVDSDKFDYFSLGYTYYENDLVYLAEVSRNQTYGAFYNGKLCEGKNPLGRQYSSATQNKFYGWLPSSTRSLSLISDDGSYFHNDLSSTTVTQQMKIILKDKTNVYQLSQGNVKVNSSGTITYFQKSGTSRTSEANKSDLYISETQTPPNNAKVTVQSDCTVQFAPEARCDVLSVEGGTIKVKGTANFNTVDIQSTAQLDLTLAAQITVNKPKGLPLSSRILLASTQPRIILDGTQVWSSQIATTDYGVLTDVKQANTPLTKGERYFGDTPPYYFWLNNAADDLTFTAGSSSKYYYATTAKQHNQTLQPATYKAQIASGEPSTITRYKNLSQAFSAATNGQTILLTDHYSPASTETATLSGDSHPEVTFDLDSYDLGGTFQLNANGGRLILDSKNNGKLNAATALSGRVFNKACSFLNHKQCASKDSITVRLFTSRTKLFHLIILLYY